MYEMGLLTTNRQPPIAPTSNQLDLRIDWKLAVSTIETPIQAYITSKTNQSTHFIKLLLCEQLKDFY